MKIDLRKVSEETLKIIKVQIIAAIESGRENKEISEIIGVRKRKVDEIWKEYERKGTESLEIKKRGRKVGEKRILTEEEEKEMQKEITENTPQNAELWERKDIAEYAMKKYNKKISLQSISDYCKRWKMSPQKPVKRAYKQDKKK